MRYPLPWFPLSDGPSLISHIARDADLVAVEVVGLLAVFAFFVGPVVDLCQGFVTVGIGVDIGIPAVRLDFLR